MKNLTEQTLILIKPDTLQRGLAGEIITRFERAGFKIVKAQIVEADERMAEAHYPITDEWLNKVGNNTLDDCKKYDLDVLKLMGTEEPQEIGKLVYKWNKDMLLSGPILAMVMEGYHAVENARRLAGPTVPVLAPPGTIRGDYSIDSAISANSEKRTIRTVVHASGSLEEAQREIALWFGKLK